MFALLRGGDDDDAMAGALYVAEFMKMVREALGEGQPPPDPRPRERDHRPRRIRNTPPRR